MWDGFDKRKFPRLSLTCEITIHSEEEPKPISATTENLGIGGVCVFLDHALERFSTCRIKLDLGSKNPRIECAGKVVWTVPTRQVKQTKRRFDTGIEFVDLDVKEQEFIRGYIETELRKSPEKLVGR